MATARSHMKGGGSSSGDGSGGGAAVSTHIIVGDVERNVSGDSCSFYRLAESQTCRRARSCFDCLNTPVDGVQSCVLTPQGFCRTMSWYDPLADFRRDVSGSAAASTAYHNYFPSTNTSYCAPTDAACARCRQIADSNAGARLNATVPARAGASDEEVRQFCLGTHGCVCLLACEDSRWNESVPESCPSDPFAPQEAVTTHVESYRAYFPIFMGIQMLVIAMLLYRRRAFARLRNRNRAVAEGPYNNVNAISSPSNRLRLSGWRAGREAQMNREKNPRMYLHLDTPAHMHFTEELQQRIEPSQSLLQPPQDSSAVEAVSARGSHLTWAADAERHEEASTAPTVAGSTVATDSPAPSPVPILGNPDRESASDLDLKELDTLLQLKQ
ncbi:hypothetical protein PybrP1_000003 [[Pythium] brassicae (nom. inval.)]|nr:hypothetical protein PybrP1_000003 [[Pythium] brassicae (nom. inval.)]